MRCLSPCRYTAQVTTVSIPHAQVAGTVCLRVFVHPSLPPLLSSCTPVCLRASQFASPSMPPFFYVFVCFTLRMTGIYLVPAQHQPTALPASNLCRGQRRSAAPKLLVGEHCVPLALVVGVLSDRTIPLTHRSHTAHTPLADNTAHNTRLISTRALCERYPSSRRMPTAGTCGQQVGKHCN